MATATFDDILSAQRETNELLGKQRNPLDGRTGAGKALLDAQRETTSILSGELQDLKGKQPSPSQIKETNKDTKNAQDARFGALGKILKNQFGKFATAFSNLNKAAKGGILAGLTALGLFALAKFLRSETFKKIADLVTKQLQPALDSLYKNILNPLIDFFAPKFQKFFTELLDFLQNPTLEGLGKLIMDNKIAVASLAALLAPKLFLKGLKAAFFFGKKSLKFAMTALTTDLGKVATDLKAVSTDMKKKSKGQLGKMKLAGGALINSTKAILAPFVTTAAVFTGAVGLFLGLLNAVTILADDVQSGNLTFGTIGRMFKGFLEGLAEIPTRIAQMVIPEDIRERVMVGLGDLIDAIIGGIKGIGNFLDDAIIKPIKVGFDRIATDVKAGLKIVGDFIDDTFIEPIKLAFDRIATNVKAGIERIGDFFDNIIAPFQRAIRAFQEYDGIIPGGGIVEAGKAFFDPNYFGEPPPSTMDETYGFAGDRMPRTELMQAMTGNLDTRTGQRFADASLDKSERETTVVRTITVNNVDASSGKGATSNNFSNTPIADRSDPYIKTS